MSADQPTATTGISRRTLATAAMWSVPVVAAVAAAPAYAISPNQCYTMTWTSGSGGTTYTTSTGIVNGQSVPVTVSSTISSGTAVEYGGQGASYAYKTGKGQTAMNFKRYSAGAQQSTGAGGQLHTQSNAFVVASGSTGSVLVLNQGSTDVAASQTVKFTFGGGQKPKSVTFNLYDITQSRRSQIHETTGTGTSTT